MNVNDEPTSRDDDRGTPPTERRRPPRFEDLPPGLRAKIEADRAYRKTPEGRAEIESVRKAVMEEYPPASSPGRGRDRHPEPPEM